MKRVKLTVFGITYSQVQEGAYALVLSQEDGDYRIPIVVGAAEAQSIAICLERITPPRPMTHDLFVSMGHAFGVELKEVFIYKFEDGVFYSELTFECDNTQVTIDSRTSDAIALSLRTNAPIYTTEEILKRTGFLFDERISVIPSSPSKKQTEKKEVRIDQYAVEELEKMLQQYVADEEYEKAAEIKVIINNKRDKKNKSN
ncbi:MAG: bifunctional nuclease family protein [Muribaculaceae bacterium]|nr:bifunctional nuclease family protein [Muribaculaceae bacterium]